MKYILSVVILIFFISCGTTKNQIENQVEVVKETTSVNTDYNTILTISIHIPYCGGARPTEDMLNRYKFVEDTFDIIDENGNSQEVQSNEFGIINIDLQPGKYQLKELSRRIPFELFYTTNTLAIPDIKRGTKKCYEEWYNQSIMSFEITDTTTSLTANGMLYSNCYTKNPCDKYTGPYAP